MLVKEKIFGTLKGEKEFYFYVGGRKRKKEKRRSVSGGHCHVIASSRIATTGGSSSSLTLPDSPCWCPMFLVRKKEKKTNEIICSNRPQPLKNVLP